MFPNRLDLLQLIPKPETIDVTRLLGGVIEHDTCATARSLGYKLQDTIFAIARENNMPSNKLSYIKVNATTILDVFGLDTSPIILDVS